MPLNLKSALNKITDLTRETLSLSGFPLFCFCEKVLTAFNYLRLEGDVLLRFRGIFKNIIVRQRFLQYDVSGEGTKGSVHDTTERGRTDH